MRVYLLKDRNISDVVFFIPMCRCAFEVSFNFLLLEITADIDCRNWRNCLGHLLCEIYCAQVFLKQLNHDVL